MVVPVEQLSIKATYLGATPTGSTKAALGDRLGQIINVKTDFGAAGDGSTNDQPAIQAALDAAFGPAASPHGDTNKSLNRPVYFPGGDYKILTPLYLTHVIGGWIFGAGTGATRITYAGSLSGNTVAPATSSGGLSNANTYTPIFMTNGWAYSTLEKMNLSIAGTKTTAFYLFQDGTQGSSTTNMFNELLIDGASTYGMFMGYQSNGLCSECQYVNVFLGNCADGLRIQSFNSLNHNVYGGGAFNCTNAGYNVTAGQINVIVGASMANPGVGSCDFLSLSNTPMSIIGGRTESLNCVHVSPGQVYMDGFQCQCSAATPGTFVEASNANVVMDACVYAPANAGGIILSLGSSGIGIMDNFITNTGLGGTITGSTGAKLYIRGCRFDPSTATTIAPFVAGGGTVAQNI